MSGKILQPQMTQMNADVLNAFICANLCNLWLIKTLKEILEEIGV